jgi:hypothetical protein
MMTDFCSFPGMATDRAVSRQAVSSAADKQSSQAAISSCAQTSSFFYGILPGCCQLQD